ncbi:MAG: 50S ribosomal protein L1 [Candidatus Saganbacteria bacterium]|nr:50S ribosomal protein L1 [Candidatus Saganbacteria bacterium]
MRKRSKKYVEKIQKLDRAASYSVEDAVKMAKQSVWAKFDESVDLAAKLGFDLKKTGGSVRGTLVMPGGTTKKKIIAVIAKGEKITEAEQAGAEVVGSNELIDKINGGFLGFDVLIATPDMMAQIGKLGKILGTKGLMPNPKAGTVTFDIAQTVKEFKAGKVEFKADKAGVIHLNLGKASFTEPALLKNLMAVLKAIHKAKPSGAKGTLFKTVYISTTMGPSLKLDIKKVMDLLDAKEE